MEIRLQVKARKDLNKMYADGVKYWGEEQADKYYSKVSNAIDAFSLNPLLGRACDEVRKGYRKHPVKEHVIYYRVSKVVTIIRVLPHEIDHQSLL